MDVIGVENMIWYHYSTSLLDEMRIYAAEEMTISRSDANVFSVLEVSLVDHNKAWGEVGPQQTVQARGYY